MKGLIYSVTGGFVFFVWLIVGNHYAGPCEHVLLRMYGAISHNVFDGSVLWTVAIMRVACN